MVPVGFAGVDNTMESLRQSLTAGLLKRIEKELGREVTVRLLWPSIVGSRLASHTQLKGVRGNTLLVSVPDRSWLGPLESMSRTVLDAVNRMGIGKVFDSIEFVEDKQLRPPPAAPRQEAVDAHPGGADDLLTAEAGLIADEGLRRLFLASARKYRSSRSA